MEWGVIRVIEVGSNRHCRLITLSLSNAATTTSPSPIVRRRAIVSSVSTISCAIFGMFSIVHRRPSAGCAVCLRRERNWRDGERKIWSSSGVVVVVGRGRTCCVRRWSEGVGVVVLALEPWHGVR